MNSLIVKDTIASIIDDKVYKLKNRGVIVANYDEVLHLLTAAGYSESEIKRAIIELRDTGAIRTGKFRDGRGWLREVREMDSMKNENNNDSRV